MTIRKITDEQFSDGLNIDGDRLDKAFQEVQTRLNKIPLEDIKTRFKPFQLVGGYDCRPNFFTKLSGASFSPSSSYSSTAYATGKDNHLPATWNFNDPSLTYTVYDAISELTYQTASSPTSEWERYAQNPVSIKGTEANTNYEDLKLSRNYVMSNAFFFKKPVIITGISVEIQGDAERPFPWVSGSGPRGGGALADLPRWNGSPILECLQFVLSVDDPFNPDDVQSRTNEWIKQNFLLSEGAFRVVNGVPATFTALPDNAGLPAFNIDNGNGGFYDRYFGEQSLFFIYDDLNISIPQEGRVRLHILMPDIQDGLNPLNGILFDDYSQIVDLFQREITWTITGLEEIE